jgi:hypothetical protein
MFNRLKESVSELIFEPKIKKRDFIYLDKGEHVIVGTYDVKERTGEIVKMSALNTTAFGQGQKYVERAAKELDLPTDELSARLKSNQQRKVPENLLYYRTRRD